MMANFQEPAIQPTGAGDPTYAYNRAPMGPRCEFVLHRDAIAWQAGRRAGRMAFADVRRVRLSFRTVKFFTDRFIAEIWSASGGKIVISSTSWKSMAEQISLDPAYRAFIVELHRRLAAAGIAASFEAGMSPWLYWPGLAVVLATALAIAALAVEALRSGETAGALFVGGFLALFLWRIGGHVRRNRPATYRPDALPPGLVPPS